MHTQTLGSTYGLIESNGTSFIADGGNNPIVTVPVGGGTATLLTITGQTLCSPSGLSESNGQLFIAGAGIDSMYS